MFNIKMLIVFGAIFVGTTCSQYCSASLIAKTSQGANLVYDDVTKSIWPSDANLLGTMENKWGKNNFVNTIISANNGAVQDSSGSIPSGYYHLSVADFSSALTDGSGNPISDIGLATWWGAKAFINYLNSISYGGYTNWALPVGAASLGHDQLKGQLAELFFNGLGGIANNSISSHHNNNYLLFNNLKAFPYWYGSIEPWQSTIDLGYKGIQPNPNPPDAWYLNFNDSGQFTAYATTTFNILPVASVPITGTIWFFSTSLISYLAINKRRSRRTIHA